MQCVILAGGLGTRMRRLTGDLPKAMIPVLGKPFLFYQLEWLARQDVRQVVLCIGYGGNAIAAAVGGGARFGLSVAYADEGEFLRGTGRALRLAADLGLLEDGFFVLYGDSYLPIDLLPVWRTSDGGRVPTMTVMRNEGRWDKGNVVFRNGKLVLYDKSATGPATIGMDYTDYGVLVLTQEIIVAGIATGEVADLGRVLNRLSIEGRLKGHEIFERFYEVGSPDGLAEFERYIGLSPARGLNVGVTPRTTTSMPSKEEPLRVSSQGLAICLLPVDVESLGLAGQLLPLVPRARDPARSMPRRLIRLRRGQRARMRRGSELGCLTS